jgi:hypothetical protein
MSRTEGVQAFTRRLGFRSIRHTARYDKSVDTSLQENDAHAFRRGGVEAPGACVLVGASLRSCPAIRGKGPRLSGPTGAVPHRSRIKAALLHLEWIRVSWGAEVELRSRADRFTDRCVVRRGTSEPLILMPHPYTTTVHGLNALIEHLRTVFPARLTPVTLRTWRIGRSNESSLLATLRFLGVVDEDRNTLPQAREVFTAPTDEEFAEGFANMVRSAYGELFEEFGEDAWTLSRDALISYMKAADRTSARVRDQQAVTFQTLARHAGRGTAIRASSREKGGRRPAPLPDPSRGGERSAPGHHAEFPQTDGIAAGINVVSTPGANMRNPIIVNINLPLTDNSQVYDDIFRSLRQHLIDS